MSNKKDIHIIFCMLFLLSFAHTVYAQTPTAAEQAAALAQLQADAQTQASTQTEQTTATEETPRYIYPDTSTFTGPNGIKEIQEKVYYNVLPSSPRIGDEVEIEAEMYGTQAKNATFSWSVNGREISTGIGQYKFSFLLSEKSTVVVKIITGEANIVTNTWQFNPRDTTIIWEARTYTPPFYRGKSLYSPESNLVLNAIDLDTPNPLTNTYNNYVWKVDGEVKGDLSGVGKNTYIYKGDLLMQEPLFQVITSPISTYNKKNTDKTENLASLRVQTLKTEILAYENDPLLGILFNKQVGTNFLFDKEESGLVAYPMYFGTASSLGVQYRWYANDELVGQNINNLTFRRTRSNEQSRLSVNIENPVSLLQSADISYIIDTTSNTNFFGFGQN